MERGIVSDHHEFAFGSFETIGFIVVSDLLTVHHGAPRGPERLQNLFPTILRHFVVQVVTSKGVTLVVLPRIDLGHPGFCGGKGAFNLVFRTSANPRSGGYQKAKKTGKKQEMFHKR